MIKLISILSIFFLFLTTTYSLEFKILHTNDLHSYVIGQPDKGIGHYSRLTTLINKLRTKNTLVLDAGDFYSGTIYHWLAPVEDLSFPEWEFFTHNNYDAVTLGNHEFDAKDKGLEVMFQKMKKQESKVPIVLTNSKIKDPHFIKSITKTFHHERERVTVGVIGAIGPDACLVSRNNRIKYQFYGQEEGQTHWGSLTKVLQEEVNKLKRNNVDIIVLLVHGGGAEDVEYVKRLKGLNIIIAGHTHEVYFKKVNNVYVSQAGSYGNKLGELVFDYTKDKQLILKNKEHYSVNQAVKLDKKFQARVSKYNQELNNYAKSLGLNLSERYPKRIEGKFQKFDPKFHLFFASSMYKSIKKEDPEIDLYFTVKGLIRNGIDLGSDYTLSDIFKVVPLGFHDNFRPGDKVVTFYLKRSELGLIKDFLTLYAKKNHKFSPIFSPNISFKKRWWGIPLVNNYDVSKNDGSLDKEYVKFATNKYISKYLQFVSQKTYGIFNLYLRDENGEIVKKAIELKFPEYRYFSNYLKRDPSS
ncbi:MAG: hypothetical protein GY909_12895 [Oligoflexia bacterium]|nr:hypothetical protein [Oligoflexia bacterium]